MVAFARIGRFMLRAILLGLLVIVPTLSWGQDAGPVDVVALQRRVQELDAIVQQLQAERIAAQAAAAGGNAATGPGNIDPALLPSPVGMTPSSCNRRTSRSCCTSPARFKPITATFSTRPTRPTSTRSWFGGPASVSRPRCWTTTSSACCPTSAAPRPR